MCTLNSRNSGTVFVDLWTLRPGWRIRHRMVFFLSLFFFPSFFSSSSRPPRPFFLLSSESCVFVFLLRIKNECDTIQPSTMADDLQYVEIQRVLRSGTINCRVSTPKNGRIDTNCNSCSCKIALSRSPSVGGRSDRVSLECFYNLTKKSKGNRESPINRRTTLLNTLPWTVLWSYLKV